MQIKKYTNVRRQKFFVPVPVKEEGINNFHFDKKERKFDRLEDAEIYATLIRSMFGREINIRVG